MTPAFRRTCQGHRNRKRSRHFEQPNYLCALTIDRMIYLHAEFTDYNPYRGDQIISY
ncbi:protein of unknown function [Aminobacter niigataensis]|nr:protein of unknown function [Aminobacter niigataensis]